MFYKGRNLLLQPAFVCAVQLRIGFLGISPLLKSLLFCSLHRYFHLPNPIYRLFSPPSGQGQERVRLSLDDDARGKQRIGRHFANENHKLYAASRLSTLYTSITHSMQILLGWACKGSSSIPPQDSLQSQNSTCLACVHKKTGVFPTSFTNLPRQHFHYSARSYSSALPSPCRRPGAQAHYLHSGMQTQVKASS